MELLYLMILCSVSLAVIFLIIFIYNARKGQFDDDESPAVRILLDKDNPDERDEQGEEKDRKKKKIISD
ncbi:cbb3-type cytochrome oxidase assembly protein CcoS [Chryseobacterium lacus]|uniref:Cbb3-type cytochrome oxidase assembly protein CcoS n=1 Tax=Chryseobacterium lacus TaxID=2058346 RepID=A0A368N1P3_9FLAO|nr:cbb3-type cytochrome oxidase assembly protein CcoS [Chryseobacterium lacus]ODS86088.1 MAG: cytochrome oxidase maturation protein, cbb3-type [Chryseobacterium sp. SCN 40-13]RCU44090.1 cbb3-type cytochrome oxidase assembly protein CcoS [Chryseobacterium lacus]RST29020.1 cbb3-type cytochrome oxidase assembly protein CcoS [Chryseobacterium lacus]